MMSSKSNTSATHLPTPQKASTDKKDYRAIRLPNGLRVLLISDTTYDLEKLDLEENLEQEEEDEMDDSEGSSNDEEDDSEDEEMIEDPKMLSSKSVSGLKKSAAGLCIGIGSFSDPFELPGLAHFLEHMVFMGSEKYPDENSFDQFIQKHGGFDNAHTDCENTTFYFELQRKHFKEGLDRFAQFFISPLMKKDAMQREREAVDSEFQMNLISDYARKQQLFGSFARDQHPMTKFMWGNLSSLQMSQKSDDEVHKILQSFNRRHYSAHFMTLAVQSQETLDTLEDMVVQSFSNITNNQKNKETFENLIEPFKTEPSKFCKLYKMIPMQNINELDVSWALPPLLQKFKAKPLHYLGTIIGHEGKGSLILYLRQKAWALQLSAGNSECGFENNTTYSNFAISIILTKSGYENIDQVLEAIFSYLKMLKQSGASYCIYEEIRRVDELDFEYGQQPQPMDNVEHLCEGMQLYPPELYLTGGDLLFEFDQKLIEDITNNLNGEGANIFILSKDYENVATKTEPWFKTKYIDEDIPMEWKEVWRNTNIFPEFHLPPPNIFIAENVNLIPQKETGDKIGSKYPLKLKDDASGELFYRLDDIFNQPRAIAIFNLRSPLARESVEHGVCLDLVVSCLGQIMIKDTYAADQALLEHTVSVGERGEINIKINGLNDKLLLLLQTIMKHISELHLNDDLSNIFESVRDQTKKNYYNFFIKPSKLVRDARLSVLQDVHWTAMEKHKAIKNVSLEMVKSFAKEFLFTSNVYVQGLVQGNVTETEAIEMYNVVKAGLIDKGEASAFVTDIRCNEIPEGHHFLRINGVNPKDTNTLVTNYYQSKHASSLENHMMMEVALMLMEEPVFDILRTKEQLGYTVFSMLRNTYGILGVSITVNTQATKFSADHVNARIEAFLEWFIEEKLGNLDDAEFEETVATLIKVSNMVLFL